MGLSDLLFCVELVPRLPAILNLCLSFLSLIIFFFLPIAPLPHIHMYYYTHGNYVQNTFSYLFIKRYTCVHRSEVMNVYATDSDA
jgi:hypothetical protein